MGFCGKALTGECVLPGVGREGYLCAQRIQPVWVDIECSGLSVHWRLMCGVRMKQGCLVILVLPLL